MFSQHSYGYAIDINPLTNPYVKASKNLVLPPQGSEFADRSIYAKGKITKESQIYSAEEKRILDELKEQQREKRENELIANLRMMVAEKQKEKDPQT